MNYDAFLLYLYVHGYVVNTCASQMHMRHQGRICHSTKMKVWRKVATTAKYRGKIPIVSWGRYSVQACGCLGVRCRTVCSFVYLKQVAQNSLLNKRYLVVYQLWQSPWRKASGVMIHLWEPVLMAGSMILLSFKPSIMSSAFIISRAQTESLWKTNTSCFRMQVLERIWSKVYDLTLCSFFD